MYEAPSQEIFDEMKRIATSIWIKYDNTYWYVDEKLWYINQIENFQDNAMVMYRMFDNNNQHIFYKKASKDVINYIINNQ